MTNSDEFGSTETAKVVGTGAGETGIVTETGTETGTEIETEIGTGIETASGIAKCTTGRLNGTTGEGSANGTENRPHETASGIAKFTTRLLL